MLIKPLGLLKAAALAGGIGYVGGNVHTGFAPHVTQTFSLTSLSGGSAAAPSEGDIVVIMVAAASSTTRTAPANVVPGYTRVYASTADIFENSTHDSNLTVWYKVMGASPDTSVDVYATNSSEDAACVLVRVYSGVDTTTPLDVTPVSAIGGASLDPDPPAVTPATAGAWIVAFGMYANDGASTAAITSTGLVNTHGTERIYSTKGAAIHAGDYTSWTSGAYDPAAFATTETSAEAAGGWAAGTFALRPA